MQKSMRTWIWIVKRFWIEYFLQILFIPNWIVFTLCCRIWWKRSLFFPLLLKLIYQLTCFLAPSRLFLELMKRNIFWCKMRVKKSRFWGFGLQFHKQKPGCRCSLIGIRWFNILLKFPEIVKLVEKQEF